jgi:putative PIN family toxin of toxin-antitoxin system
MGPLRVVFDTNVLVSALGFGGTPLRALLATFEDDVQLLATEATLDELDRVMVYERLPISDAERQQFLLIIRSEAELVETTPDLSVIDADPDDDAFLEGAIGGRAGYVGSGDEHLLALGSYRRGTGVTPATFVTEGVADVD